MMRPTRYGTTAIILYRAMLLCRRNVFPYRTRVSVSSVLCTCAFRFRASDGITRSPIAYSRQCRLTPSTLWADGSRCFHAVEPKKKHEETSSRDRTTNASTFSGGPDRRTLKNDVNFANARVVVAGEITCGDGRVSRAYRVVYTSVRGDLTANIRFDVCPTDGVRDRCNSLSADRFGRSRRAERCVLESS